MSSSTNKRESPSIEDRILPSAKEFKDNETLVNSFVIRNN